jgi:hypothetical protein
MTRIYDFTVYVEAENEDEARAALDVIEDPGVRWELNDGNQDDDDEATSWVDELHHTGKHEIDAENEELAQ